MRVRCEPRLIALRDRGPLEARPGCDPGALHARPTIPFPTTADARPARHRPLAAAPRAPGARPRTVRTGAKTQPSFPPASIVHPSSFLSRGELSPFDVRPRSPCPMFSSRQDSRPPHRGAHRASLHGPNSRTVRLTGSADARPKIGTAGSRWRQEGSNLRRGAYETPALPTELCRHPGFSPGENFRSRPGRDTFPTPGSASARRLTRSRAIVRVMRPWGRLLIVGCSFSPGTVIGNAPSIDGCPAAFAVP